MPLTSSQQKQLNDLKDLAGDLTMLATEGEEFHKEYKKNKEAFRLLIRSERKVEKAMRMYFKGFARRLQYQVNWLRYDLKINTASEIDDWIEVDWDKEAVEIKVLLNQALVDALQAGGNVTKDEFSQDVDWDSTSKTFNDYLNNYTVKLSTQLNKTSQDRLVSSIKTSLSNHETIEEATQRVRQVIDDPKRASRIARTESIKAFAEGRVQAGKMMGATHKEWSSTLQHCPICGAMDGQIVGIDEEFRYQDMRFERPPAHPNCRCYVRLRFDDR